MPRLTAARAKSIDRRMAIGRGRLTAGLCAFAVALGVITVGLASCSTMERDFNATSSGASSGPGGGGDAGCDPARSPGEDACVITNELGVFVEDGGNDLNPGTKVAPVKTIAKAMELAGASGKRVYACAQAFNEPVVIPAGMELFGGLDCENGWGWIGADAKTTIATGPDVIPATLLEGERPTRLDDFWIQAAGATVPGGSSIALIASGVKTELVRCTIVAGDAMPGEDGEDAPASPAPAGPPGAMAPNGPPCIAGVPALPGGPPTQNPECPASIGGKGGDSFAGAGQPGTAGLPELGGGAGGEPYCTAGGDGADGPQGVVGAGAASPGILTSEGYAGQAGGDGTAGDPAQGGGGGGGHNGGFCGGMPAAGSPGGGGGAGGCGGAGGAGGRPGGSSIAIASVGASLTLTDVSLTAGNGGPGGAGGDAQPGGEGGPGGLPGFSPSFPQACPGGKGGIGGSGGPGGGGAGGHSLGVAYTGPEPSQTNVAFTGGLAGVGGPGGSGNAFNNAGVDGSAVVAQALPES
jgi:hypothetical protein